MERSSAKTQSNKSRHKSRPIKLFTKFTSKDVKRLKDEFGVSASRSNAFIRDTQQYVVIFNRSRAQKRDIKQTRKDLAVLIRTSSQLFELSNRLIWPQSEKASRNDILTSHLIHQMSSLRFATEVSPEFAETSAQSKFGPKLSAENEGSWNSRMDVELLFNGSRYLQLSRGSEKSALGLQGLFLSLLLAIHEGAKEAGRSLNKKGAGSPQDLEMAWLVDALVPVFEKYTKTKPTKGRKGLFAKYLTLCLGAVGEQHGDVFPLLGKALGPKPSRQQQRRDRESLKSRGSEFLLQVAFKKKTQVK